MIEMAARSLSPHSSTLRLEAVPECFPHSIPCLWTIFGQGVNEKVRNDRGMYEIAAQWSVVEKAGIHYIADFFLTVSPDSMLAVGRHAPETGKTMCFNLFAPFLVEVPPCFASMKGLFPYIVVVFGSYRR